MGKRAKRVYRKLRRPLEWFAIWLGLVVIPPLSLSSLLKLSRFVADTAFIVDKTGKAVARANLRLMFGSRMTPVRERALIRRSYRNMARVLVNVFWMSRDTRKRMDNQVTFDPRVL